MRQSLQFSMLIGASIAAISFAGAVASEPAAQTVLTAPAPQATHILPDDINSATPRGGDITLQNDILADFGTSVLQFGFVNGEIGAARYNINPDLFPIKIKAVQIYWASSLSNGTESLQDAINIYTGNFNLIANLEGPVLTDGVLNVFDLDPLNIVINSPTQLTVGLQFFDGPNGDGLKPTLATDGSGGCQSGLNWVFVSGTTWLNLCAFGVNGDLVIRTVIDPMGSVIPCPEDINGDDVIDTADLGLLIAVFGQMPPTIPEADINGDGVVDTADLGSLIAEFGNACP